jgi:hypothetical protein
MSGGILLRLILDMTFETIDLVTAPCLDCSIHVACTESTRAGGPHTHTPIPRAEACAMIVVRQGLPKQTSTR